MAPIQQSQIPTVAFLYATKKLVPAAGQPLYAASNIFSTAVGLIRTDITTLELKNGAIVNAANKRLLGGGGVDGAIHRAAGFGLLNECRTLGGAQTGESKITNAYNLPCKKVIHTVGPVYSLEEKAQELLTSCYESSLKLAVENGLNAIAFSAVSTGIYGYPSAKAARTALKTVRKFLETDDGKKLDLVVFCNFEKKDEDAYHELIPLYFPPVEESRTNDTSEKAAKVEVKAEVDAEPEAVANAEPEAEGEAEPEAIAKAEPEAQTEAELEPKAEPIAPKDNTEKAESTASDEAKADEGDGEWVRV